MWALSISLIHDVLPNPITRNPVAPYRRQQASRVARDLREMLDHKSDPGEANKTEGERHAYATQLSVTEARTRV